MMPDIFDQYSHPRPEGEPIIYAFSDTRYPGCLKVGYTARPIEVRMREHYPTLTPEISYNVDLIESALYPDGSVFKDHDVHRVLERKGIPALLDENSSKTEWYKCDVGDVEAAIIAVKTHTENEENRTQTFSMRPEQRAAVEKTVQYYVQENQSGNEKPKFLWNCKMRFGKTFAAYQLAKALGMKRVLILTFKPAVENAWEEDLLSHVDFEGWQFYSRKREIELGITPDDLNDRKPIVCFGSFQDFLGTNDSGGIKAKNEWVHATHWDLVIFDEYHFGAWRENAKDLFNERTTNEDIYEKVDYDEYAEKEADNAYNESFLPITTNYYLYLSGTPFRALNTGEFLEDQVYSWTYSDEQRAKAEWTGPDANPYESLPRMVMMTYKMPDEISQVASTSEFNEFDLNSFFGAEYEGRAVEEAEFIHKNEVQKWLDLIRGSYRPSTVEELRAGENRPVMPFSDIRLLGTCNHTLWFLPNVASCHAMANLLKERQNTFYHEYKVNVCAGSSAGIGLDALPPVRQSMDNPLESKTITLTCGKLTTGVTIRPWGGILMLRSLSSPETYFQAAFRVQSPWEITDEFGNTEILKHECYVFDFDINRALREISEYSCEINVEEHNPEKKVADFIHFLPVLAYDGSRMMAVDAADILDLTTAGTSATLLARRWESALLVNVDDLTLQKILNNEKALSALMSIEGFRNLNSDIEVIINRSKEVKKRKQEPGLPKKEKKKLTEEEKELKSKRKQIQEKLIKFATRIPIFMYLTDYREYSLKDVITKLEPGLFKKVTGLTIPDFELLVSIGVFDESRMNDAVYAFKRYEDASLEYTGISKHSSEQDIGLFSTTISREDYEKLASMQQQSTMTNTTEVEIQPEQIQIESRIVEAIKVQPTAEDETPLDLGVGDVVIHNKFGEGTIINFDQGRIEVEFEEGTKRFSEKVVQKKRLLVKK